MTSPASPGTAKAVAGRSAMARAGGIPSQAASGSLADLLERVLDKGVVIVGDVVVSILDIELLTLKLRLLIASVDTAQQMGIDWWKNDPFVSSGSGRSEVEQENERLRRRIAELEEASGDDAR